LQPLAPTISMAENLRSFANCIQGCNDGYASCGDRCLVDCKAMFETGTPELTACVDACKALCNTVKLACKDRCQAIKDGVSPPEP